MAHLAHSSRAALNGTSWDPMLPTIPASADRSEGDNYIRSANEPESGLKGAVDRELGGNINENVRNL